MDKKKVIVHINNVSKILGTKRQTLSAGALEHLQNELKLALIELSKSDWISVEDELPQYDEEVLICNKYFPNDIYITHRYAKNSYEYDRYGFINTYQATHWRKIDKLEDEAWRG